MRDHVETAFRGQFLTALRNQGCFVRFQLTGDVNDRLDSGHLEIQPLGYDLAQQAHISILNVPAILAKVYSDAVRTAKQREYRRGGRFRFLRTPRLSKCGHMIDVHTEPDHAYDLAHRGSVVKRRFVADDRYTSPLTLPSSLGEEREDPRPVHGNVEPRGGES